jgi:glycosyltransferase involved in cell wall biosynthesis
VRVLLAHNFYGSGAPSGENQVFELERSLLERRGHAVATFVRHSDEIRSRGWLGLLQGALATPWNPFTTRAVRRAVSEFEPDVVHAHNTFPLISPALFPGVGRRVARVLTLHNYRLFCPAAIPLRDGRPCTECLDRRSVIPALRYGCYRGSRVATVPLALGVALNRSLHLWEKHVEAFIALTEFQREVMVAAGLPPDRVFVKPNFYPGAPKPTPWSERLPYVVFAGRLTVEKGVSTLLEAWALWGDAAPELRVVGDGPLRAALEESARSRGLRQVRFLGQLPPRDAEAEIARAMLVVLPSIWFEGFPMVLREAFAFGTPAAVSEIGPLPGIVQHGRAGVVFRPGDPRSLVETVRRAWEAPQALQAMSAQARAEFETRYSESGNYDTLMRIYGAAISRQKRRGKS